jgi:hypothetical protein
MLDITDIVWSRERYVSSLVKSKLHIQNSRLSLDMEMKIFEEAGSARRLYLVILAIY